jgi:putative RNA 2'-phosphotransferase
MLTVNVQTAVEHGVLFQQIGELLFLAPSIPPGCFQGPPLPKEKPRPHKQEDPSEAAAAASKGTFAVSPEKLANLGGTGKDSGWKGKKERRKKHKRKRERPPWRK